MIKLMKIGIVVPVYNENLRAVETIKSILKVTKNQLIVVDDGSKDESLKLLRKSFSKNKQVMILSHVVNLGKGDAMKTGTLMAWRLGMEAVIFIDADGQHNPKYLPEFEKGLEKYDLVFGYRELNGDMPLVRKWGNIVAKHVLRQVFNIKRKEFLCGFLGFKKSVYKKIRWHSDRYGVETEIATRVGKNKLSFLEIKIDTIYVDKYKGVSIFDAFRILSMIPYWYFSK